jgi:hypothetical protein
MGKPTNFLTPKQVEDLTFRGWQVNAKGFFIDLYLSDFEDEEDWTDACKIAGVNSYDTNSITLLCFGTQTDSN